MSKREHHDRQPNRPHLRLRVHAHLELNGRQEVRPRLRLPATPYAIAGSEHRLRLGDRQRAVLAAVIHLLIPVVLLLLLVVLLLLLLLLLGAEILVARLRLLRLHHLRLRCHELRV